MRSADQAARRMVGEPLFSGEPLAAYLAERSRNQWLDEVMFILSGSPFSRLRVRRGLQKAAAFRGEIRLSGTLEFRARRRGLGASVQCLVPFEGDAALWRCSWSPAPPRALTGRVVDQTLVLRVDLIDGEARYAAPLIQSEVEAIGAVLERQRAAVAAHNVEEAARLAAFVADKWTALQAMRPYAKAARERWREATLDDLAAFTRYLES